MFKHDFDIYETLAKLDSLLESGHEEPPPSNRAEYSVLMETLVEGAAELLRYLAMHSVLAFESGEPYHKIKARHVSTVTLNDDEQISNKLVTIDLPAHLVPYGAIMDSMKAWNVGTIETVADLSVLLSLLNRANNAEKFDPNLWEDWYLFASQVTPRCLSSVERLVAANIIHIVDSRTEQTYLIDRALLNDSVINLSITTNSEAMPMSRRSKKAKKNS